MSRRAPVVSTRAPRERASVRPTPPRRRSDETRRGSRPPRRATKVLVTSGVIVTVLALGAQWALHSSYLRVQHVVITGATHESAAQILRATGLASHPTMWSVSSSAVAHELDAFTWIRSVRLEKHWPDSVTIRVHELRPVAVAYDAHGDLRFVSAGGRDLGPAPLDANYPTLTYQKSTSATWPFLHAGRNAALVASELPVAFADQVSGVSVDARGVVTLHMTTPVTFVLGEPTQLHRKFVAIASVIAHSTLAPGDVVDVSVPTELAVTGPAPS